MLISIITVNLNNKEGLKRTTESIIKQSFKDFEWLVIDGASTDGSTSLIDQHCSYWVSEEDKGIYEAMNKGIAKAKGDFLLFLNSGDWLCSSNSLSQAQKTLQQPNADIYYCDVNFLDEQQQIAWQKNYPQEITIDFLLKSSLCHQAMFIKKEVFEHLGNYREKYRLSADWMFYFEALKKGFFFKKIENVRLTNFMLNGFSSNYILSKQERKDFISACYPEHLKEYLAITRNKTLIERVLIKLGQYLSLIERPKQQRYYLKLKSGKQKAKG